jgi:putative FmdB family regulatory protein
VPLYDYRCASCGREVEVMHGIHDGGPAACDACGGAMKKVLSPPAIHFKGSGWAKKDAAASTASKAKPKAASGSETAEGNKGDDAKAVEKDKGASAGKGDVTASSTSASSG